MGKSIRSNSKKAFRSQRRATVEQEPVYVASQTARLAAMERCLAAPKAEIREVVVASTSAADGMDVDSVAKPPKRGRSSARGNADASSSMDVDGEETALQAGKRGKSKQRLRLVRGAKARAGVNKKDARGLRGVIKVKQHGVSVKGKLKPRFSKSSKKKF